MYNKTLLAAVSALLIAGCADDPLVVDDPIDVGLAPAFADSSTRPPEGDNPVGEIIDPFTPRLLLNIVAETSLSPKSPITLRLEAVAAGPITGGEVFVTLPTQASMARGFRPTSEKLPVVARWTLPALAPGDTWKQRVAVGSVEEGYYHVAVDVHTQGPKTALGPYLVDETDSHRWMYVKGRGGMLTSGFDDSLFEQGIVPQPGPFSARQAAVGDFHQASSWQSDSSDDAVSVKVVYFNNGEYLPAGGAYITGAMQSLTEHPDGEEPSYSASFVVPDDGIVEFDCPEADEFLSGNITVPATQYVAGANFRGHWEAHHSDCGETLEVSSTTSNYIPWNNLNTAIPLITSDFGFSRSRVKWIVLLDDRTSRFVPTDDRIEFGKEYKLAWAAAHEYVHALHHESLGGLWNPTNCRNHGINSVTSYTCAFLEGIADYGGNVGAPDDEITRYYDWENYDGGEEGTKGKIEGYVAALFHDLLDGGSESGDDTDYEGDYVMAVFKSCRTAMDNTFEKRDDVADFVWCLENRVNKDVHNANFPGLGAPKRVRESASEPSDWSATDIRATWRKNVGS